MDLNKHFYTENFTYDQETGALKQYYGLNPEVDTTNSRYSDMNIMDAITLGPVAEPSERFIYGIGQDKITRHPYIGDLGREQDSGCKTIHDISTSDSLDYCDFPDIRITRNGNILYTTQSYLGKGIFGNAEDDGSISIVDSKGRDLSALGITTDDTVINLQDGSTADITGISTTYETNDTLDFSGGFSDGGSITAGDSWAVFLDQFADFSSSLFAGQPEKYRWSRQIIDFYGRYYILNGNSIAMLDSDEETFYPNYITSPAFVHTVDMDFNHDKIMIGGEYGEKGMILVWQAGLGDNFLAIMTLPFKVKSVQSYETGWIVFAGNSIYYTNGYSLQKMSSVRDTDELENIGLHPQGMEIIGNKILFNIDTSLNNRYRSGIYIYNIDTGEWNLSPIIDENDRPIFSDVSDGGIFYVNETLYTSYGTGPANIVSDVNMYSRAGKSEAFYYIPNQEKSVGKVDLYLGAVKELFRRSNELDARVVVGIADGTRQIFDYQVGDADAGDNLISVDPTYNYFQVGDFVRAVSGNNAGELVFVESVTSGGAYVTPNFTNMTQDGDEYFVHPIKKLGEKNFSGGKDIKVPLNFHKGVQLYGDIFLYVWIESEGIPLEIRDIKLS